MLGGLYHNWRFGKSYREFSTRFECSKSQTLTFQQPRAVPLKLLMYIGIRLVDKWLPAEEGGFRDLV